MALAKIFISDYFSQRHTRGAHEEVEEVVGCQAQDEEASGYGGGSSGSVQDGERNLPPGAAEPCTVVMGSSSLDYAQPQNNSSMRQGILVGLNPRSGKRKVGVTCHKLCQVIQSFDRTSST